MLVETKKLKNICINILKSTGVSNQLSRLVTDDLIDNDIKGYSSHGVIRIKEYISHIKQGDVLSQNKPIAGSISNIVSKIDGNRSFGILVKKEVTSHLLTKLKKNKFGFVTFSNSGHIGRLSDIADPIIQAGGIIIGFLNFSGSGQNVIPFGANIPKLATNPIIMGAPSPKGAILIDFSTSSYSEGKLRDAYYRNKKISEDILVDKNGNSITDPKAFYEKYGEFFLTPLGGKELGYKGFGLALFTEILAGVISGGGTIASKSQSMNNSGFFITFSPEIFNQSQDIFNFEVGNLINYLTETNSENVNNNVTIPGLRKRHETKTANINLSRKTWNELINL